MKRQRVGMENGKGKIFRSLEILGTGSRMTTFEIYNGHPRGCGDPGNGERQRLAIGRDLYVA